MRRILLGLAALAGLAMCPARGQAQVSNFSDPFFLYYGWYLPRQQALANQPGPEVGIAVGEVGGYRRLVLPFTDVGGG